MLGVKLGRFVVMSGVACRVKGAAFEMFSL
jgi:hypothetical protein